jgi:hypothetical protein
LGGKDVVIVECKTVKDKDYNKFTSVSRQLKSYDTLCKKNGYHVNQVIVVSNEFTEDFIGECEYEYDIGISLLTSRDLLNIYEGLKKEERFSKLRTVAKKQIKTLLETKTVIPKKLNS